MFSGIIEEIGEVVDFRGNEVKVRCSKVLSGSKIGDSIAVNGVCLTVKDVGDNFFISDVSFETLERSNLKYISTGCRVNLERALSVGDRISGHFVQGHVDTVGIFLNSERKSNFFDMKFSYPPIFDRYVVEKGSISLNGISLTVSKCGSGWFLVSIIPHTFLNTNLKELKAGDKVNIEFDILGKYIISFLDKMESEKSKLSLDELKKHGF